jgi:hypothetical protein
MTEITVVQTPAGLRGMGEDNERAYGRFKGWLKGLGIGEFFTLSYKKPRNVRFHRKFFALLNHAFEHWEPESGRKRLKYKGLAIEKNFERFRADITVLAGYYVPSYDTKGRLVLEPKSISFANMEEEEFEKLYAAVLDALLKHVLTNYKREDVERVVEELERFA